MVEMTSIPRRDWRAFLFAWSARRRGWPVRLEGHGLDLPPGARHALLDVVEGSDDGIVIKLHTVHGSVTVTVSRASSVWVRRSTGGADEALEVMRGPHRKVVVHSAPFHEADDRMFA